MEKSKQNWPGLDEERTLTSQHPETMRKQFIDSCKSLGLIVDDTYMCSGIGLDGKLDYGMMFGMDDGHVIAVSPFWYEVRDGQKYYRLSKQITKPTKMYRTK